MINKLIISFANLISLIMWIIGVIGFIFAMFPKSMIISDIMPIKNIIAIGTTMLLASVFYFSMSYLQNGKKKNTNLRIDPSNEKEINFEAMKTDIENLKNSMSTVSKNKQDSLIESVKNQILNQTTNSVLDALQNKFLKNDKYQYISDNIENTRIRLLNELHTLNQRANLNLTIGILITTAVIVMFTSFLFNVKLEFTDFEQFIIFSLPKALFVIFIEFFAYFFLQIYKTSLVEIKFIQNELTNIEHKHLALLISLEEGRDMINEVVSEFIKTERNRLLEKGQTLYELEQARIENESNANIMKYFSNLTSK